MPRIIPRRSSSLALAALALIGPAAAADLDYPPYPAPQAGPPQVYRGERIEEELPPPRPEPVYPGVAAGPRFVPPAEDCRTIVKRRIDEDGAEVERRIRICDERLTEARPPGPRFRPSVYGPPSPVPPSDVPGRWAEPRW